jgi:S1-C subfamily serine protease
MDQQAIEVHLRKAAVEAIASYTVGIAVLDNTAIGTGTLISYLGKRYVLTAKHVIAGAAIETIRF